MYDECNTAESTGQKTRESTGQKTIIVAYIAWFCHRRWCTKRKPEQSPDPQPTEADTTYEELDLSKMNTEDNYQSLKRDVSINNQDLIAK